MTTWRAKDHMNALEEVGDEDDENDDDHAKKNKSGMNQSAFSEQDS